VIMAQVFVLMSLVFVGAVRGQDRGETVKVNGFSRTMVVHLPLGYSATKRYPVVLVLHGVGADAASIARITHFNRIANQNGFIVVYPNAKDGRWTAAENDAVRNLGGFGRRQGGMGGIMEPRRDIEVGGRPVDDMLFFNELLDQIEQEYSVDESRVYATGLSDGGIMDFRLGCELAGRIAAIAPVAATFPQSLQDSCSNWFWRAVPILMINGTSDPIVPYNGRLSYNAGHFLLPAKDSVKAWAKMDDCGMKPEKDTIPAKASGGLETRVESYTECKDGAAAVLYSIEKGGHTWPGGEQYMPEQMIGRTSDDFDAGEVIWKFFADHPMPVKKVADQKPAAH
jgi:polyhydroxybutyrate depolymerase